MWLRFISFVILITLVLAEPYGKGGGRGGGGRGGGGGGRGRGSSSHSYPSSGGYSGNSAGQAHSYPKSNGVSGTGNTQHNQQQTYQHNQQKTYQNNHNQQTNTYNYGKTEVHNHYHYNPPQQISYGSHIHPVYTSPPPVYVYQYRDSGSRFDNLLTGLALYNLGRMSARNSNYDVNREYRNSPGEICKLGIRKSNGDYEETRVDCRVMTSFIWESGNHNQRTQQQVVATNKTTTTTIVETTSNSNATGNSGSAHDSTVVTKVVVENKSVVDALQVKGPSMSVTPDMKCFMIHISRDTSVMKKDVDCALLQTYAQQSLYRNNNSRVMPTFMLLTVIFILYM